MEDRMGKERRRFTPEFKVEAVRLAERGDKSIRAVAADLGIHETVLKRWQREMHRAQKEGTCFAPGNGRARDEELERLKRELATVKLERDLLKHILRSTSAWVAA